MTLNHAQQTSQTVANGNGHRTQESLTAVHAVHKANSNLHPLGEKIFLDRYALKDGKKETVQIGDTVIVAVNLETGQREIGTITALNGKNVMVELREGGTVERSLEHVANRWKLTRPRCLIG